MIHTNDGSGLNPMYGRFDGVGFTISPEYRAELGRRELLEARIIVLAQEAGLDTIMFRRREIGAGSDSYVPITALRVAEARALIDARSMQVAA